jgi:hypothetical protein
MPLGDTQLLTFFNAWLADAPGNGTVAALVRWPLAA